MQQVFCKKKKTIWFIGVEVEQETSGPPPKKILDPPLGRVFWNHLVPQLCLNIKHLRASCLECLLNLSKYNHLLALIFTKPMKDDKKSQWPVNKRNKKCPLEQIHI